MAQTKAQLVVGLNVNASAPASALQIDASGNVNLDSNTLYVDATNNRVGVGTTSPSSQLEIDRTFKVKTVNTTTIADERGLTVYNNQSNGLVDTTLVYGGATTSYLAVGHHNGTSYSERLRIDSSGRVGIGTSSPAALLEASSATGSATPTPTEIRLSSTTNAADWSTTDPWARVGFYSADTTGGARLRGAIDTIQTFSNGNVSSLAFKLDDASTGLVERMRVTYDGKVGIGSTSPQAPFVVSNGGAEGVEMGWSAGASSNYVQSYNRSTSNYAQLNLVGLPLTLRNATGEAARIDSSGRLLVGTSTSDASLASSLQVVGSGYAATQLLYRYNANASGAAIFLGKSRSATIGTKTVVLNGDELGSIGFYGADGSTDVQGAVIAAQVDGTPGANDMPGRLVFSTTADGASSPTERMRLTERGVLKVSAESVYANSTGPYHEFVSGYSNEYAFRVWHRGNASQQYGIMVKTTTDQNDATRSFLDCFGDTTLRAGIRSNGGLANYSANNANLSDRNVKKDISPAADTWDCIKEWEIVNYRYKDQPDDADLNLGVIAQQVAESCPEVITVFSEAKDAKPAVVDDEGNEVEPAQEAQPEKLGVKEQQMYWMAIKALQEAQVRIEQLEAKVAALESA